MNTKRYFSFLFSFLLIASISVAAVASDLSGGPLDSQTSGGSDLSSLLQEGTSGFEGTVTITEPVQEPVQTSEMTPITEQTPTTGQAPTMVDPVVDPTTSTTPTTPTETTATLPTPDPLTPVTQTPIPTYVPPAGVLNISKHPFSENIEVGTSTSFIARADNAASVYWVVRDNVGNDVNQSQWAAHGISVASPIRLMPKLSF